MGKYGPQVQAVLEKASTIDIQMLCPLHGPIWRENLGWLIDKYAKWSSYTPEEDAVMVVYGSIYGGTESAAQVVASALSQSGVRNVAVYDVSHTHVSELIAEAFRCSHLVFASITYNMGIFTPMRNFLEDLRDHGLQNRRVAYIQNGSWSPASGKQMQEIVAQMKGMEQVGDMVTIASSPNEASFEPLIQLADALSGSINGNAAQAGAAQAPAASAKWRCKVCGFIYEGEELPPDYVCPVCGVGVEQFEKIDG